MTLLESKQWCPISLWCWVKRHLSLRPQKCPLRPLRPQLWQRNTYCPLQPRLWLSYWFLWFSSRSFVAASCSQVTVAAARARSSPKVKVQPICLDFKVSSLWVRNLLEGSAAGVTYRLKELLLCNHKQTDQTPLQETLAERIPLCIKKNLSSVLAAPAILIWVEGMQKENRTKKTRTFLVKGWLCHLCKLIYPQLMHLFLLSDRPHLVYLAEEINI